MSWLKSLISPNNENNVRRDVERLFRRATAAEVYTLPQLAEQLHVRTISTLALALAELTRDHIVDQIFRVESPKNRGGIADYTKIEDVPDTIRDWRQDAEINVEPRMVRVLFRKHSEVLAHQNAGPEAENE
ncbi:MAG: hypothetical protein ACRYGG_09380 [Janthinobacterium lividum]